MGKKARKRKNKKLAMRGQVIQELLESGRIPNVFVAAALRKETESFVSGLKYGVCSDCHRRGLIVKSNGLCAPSGEKNSSGRDRRLAYCLRSRNG